MGAASLRRVWIRNAGFFIFLFFKKTWEYLPKFALRSWTFIAAFAVSSNSIELLLKSNKIELFYYTRGILAGLSAYTEWKLVNALCSIHSKLGLYTAVFLIGSSGMFFASCALLPSTFAMICVTWITAIWINQTQKSDTTTVKLKNPTYHQQSIRLIMALINNTTVSTVFIYSIAVILGWPFAGVLVLPFIIESLVSIHSKSDFFVFTRDGIIGALLSILFILIPSILIDRVFYRRWVFASFSLL